MPAQSAHSLNPSATSDRDGTLQPLDLLWHGSGQLMWVQVEQRLRQQGYTLGWLPLSSEKERLAEVLVKRRPSWRTSPFVEPLAGCQAATFLLPNGRRMSARNVPRSAAGPDLKQLLLGGQGTPEWVEQVVLRVWPIPSSQETVVLEGVGSLDEQQKVAFQLMGEGFQRGILPTVGLLGWGGNPLGSPLQVELILHFEGEAALVSARAAILRRLATTLGLRERPAAAGKQLLYTLEKSWAGSLEPWIPLEAHAEARLKPVSSGWNLLEGGQQVLNITEFHAWKQLEQRRIAHTLPVEAVCWGVQHEGCWMVDRMVLPTSAQYKLSEGQIRTQVLLRVALDQLQREKLP